MSVSLDEWIEDNGYLKLESQIDTSCAAMGTPDVGGLTRTIMILIRQHMESDSTSETPLISALRDGMDLKDKRIAELENHVLRLSSVSEAESDPMERIRSTVGGHLGMLDRADAVSETESETGKCDHDGGHIVYVCGKPCCSRCRFPIDGSEDKSE